MTPYLLQTWERLAARASLYSRGKRRDIGVAAIPPTKPFESLAHREGSLSIVRQLARLDCGGALPIA